MHYESPRMHGADSLGTLTEIFNGFNSTLAKAWLQWLDLNDKHEGTIINILCNKNCTWAHDIILC